MFVLNLKLKDMFEKTSKGKFIIDVEDEQFRPSIYVKNEYNDICMISVIGNGNPLEDAEFVSFCFNLQQKYDIGLFEEAVRLIENIINTNSLVFYCDRTDATDLLTRIKQN